MPGFVVAYKDFLRFKMGKTTENYITEEMREKFREEYRKRKERMLSDPEFAKQVLEKRRKSYEAHKERMRSDPEYADKQLEKRKKINEAKKQKMKSDPEYMVRERWRKRKAVQKKKMLNPNSVQFLGKNYNEKRKQQKQRKERKDTKYLSSNETKTDDCKMVNVPNGIIVENKYNAKFKDNIKISSVADCRKFEIRLTRLEADKPIKKEIEDFQSVTIKEEVTEPTFIRKEPCIRLTRIDVLKPISIKEEAGQVLKKEECNKLRRFRITRVLGGVEDITSVSGMDTKGDKTSGEEIVHSTSGSNNGRNVSDLNGGDSDSEFDDVVPDSQDLEQFEDSKKISLLKRSSPSYGFMSKRFKRCPNEDSFGHPSTARDSDVKIEADVTESPDVEVICSTSDHTVTSSSNVSSNMNGGGTVTCNERKVELTDSQKHFTHSNGLNGKESVMNGVLYATRDSDIQIKTETHQDNQLTSTVSRHATSTKGHVKSPRNRETSSSAHSRKFKNTVSESNRMQVSNSEEESAKIADMKRELSTTIEIDDSLRHSDDEEELHNASTSPNFGSDNDVEFVPKMKKSKSETDGERLSLPKMPTPLPNPQIEALKRETLHSTPHSGDVDPPNGSASIIEPNSSYQTTPSSTSDISRSGKMCIIVSYDCSFNPETKKITSKKITAINPSLQGHPTLPLAFQVASDVSLGSYATDISKSSSGSVTSTGPFQLKPLSRFSLTSTSSSSSGGNVPVTIDSVRKLLDFPHDSSTDHKREKYYDILYGCVQEHIKAILEKGDIFSSPEKTPKSSSASRKIKDDVLDRIKSDNRAKKTPRKKPTKSKKKGLVELDDDEDEEEHDNVPQVETKKSRTPKSTTPKSTSSKSIKRSLEDSAPSSPVSSQSRKRPSAKKIKATPEVTTPVSRTRVRREKVAEESDVESTDMTPSIKERSESKIIDAGAIVFARWKDKKYYSGIVREKKPENRWLIHFDDGEKAVTPEKDIIIDNWLPKDFEVLVSKEKTSEFFSGRIVDFKLDEEDHEKLYGVVFDDSKDVTFVRRTKIALKEDQVHTLKQSMGTPATSTSPLVYWGDLSLANLVPGKRQRVPSSKYAGSASTSSAEVAPPSGKLRRFASSDLSSDPEQTIPLSSECIIGLDPEHFSAVELPTPKKLPKEGVKKGKSTTKSDHPTEIEILGPIPEEGSSLFVGKNFLLTCSDQSPWKRERQLALSGGEGIGSDDFEAESLITPFDRDRLLRQLRNGGAVIYDRFEDVPEESYSFCYLIANQPVCTATYVQCLAYGIRPVRHTWVIEMCKGLSIKIESYFLPAGWSLEKSMFVSFSRKSSRPLRGKELLVVSETMNPFVTFWSNIVHLLGGKTRDTENCDTESNTWLNGVYAIISEPSFWLTIKEDADRREFPIPVLTTTWLLQCLINWKLCPVDGHPAYKHDYVPPE